MSEFAVKIKRIKEPVIDHPQADRLSIIKVDDFLCISSKLEDGSHRYEQGQYVAYIPEAAILPEWLLKRLDFWDDEKNKGTLNGPDGNRLKVLKLRGIFSEGMLYPCEALDWMLTIDNNGTKHQVKEGDDVADILGITKWVPPIPTQMSGQVLNVFGHTMKYDFENFKAVPDIFKSDDNIVATEKIHGSHILISLSTMVDDELFGENKNIIVTSKGIGSNGLAFKNVPENDGNLYVKILKTLLKNGLEKKLNSLGAKTVHVFGEVFGGSVQDLKYGKSETDFRAFDIAIDGKFVNFDIFKKTAETLDLPMVPVLYNGRFDKDFLKGISEGKTTFGEVHMREGIVIKSITEDAHPIHGRKIAKMISEQYALRKNKDATEYQ